MPLTNRRAVKSALDTAQNSETVSPTVEAILQQALNVIWSDILAEPNTYTMDNLEFSVFNRYRFRFQNTIAQRAVERYWQGRVEADGER